MKLRIVYIYIFILTTYNCYAQNGYLTVIAPYENLTVALDDSVIGVSNSTIEVSAGHHLLTVTNPNRGYWMFDDYSQFIRTAEDDTLIIRPVFKRILYVQTSPFGASVYFNGEYLGKTPYYFNMTDTSRGTLILEKDFFHPHVFELSEIYTESIHIHLDPVTDMVEAQKNVLNTNQESLSRSKKLGIAFTTLTIVSGITAAYFNDLSDTKYNEYKRTGDINKMNKLYDTSLRYERISKVSFGLFQASFAISFYQLMKIVQK